jgi:hypothetical protein
MTRHLPGSPGSASARGQRPEEKIMSNGVSVGTLVWIVIGVVVALSHGYGITNFSSVLSFLLAMLLWPLVLLGVDLHISLGV